MHAIQQPLTLALTIDIYLLSFPHNFLNNIMLLPVLSDL